MGQPKKSSATTFASTTFVGPWDGQKEDAATVLNTHIQFSFISFIQRGGLGPSKTSADKRKQFFCRPEALPCKIYVSYFVGAFSVMVPTSTAYRHLFCFFVLYKNQLKACGLTATIRHAHGHLLVSKSTAFCYPKVRHSPKLLKVLLRSPKPKFYFRRASCVGCKLHDVHRSVSFLR